MKRCAFVLACFVTLTVCRAASIARAAEPRRPNILFIYTDDHSHRTVSCYPEAYPWVKTPNIDRLAKRGVRFASAYIGTWCMPSRAAMLTGHHPYGVKSMKMVGKYPGSTYDPKQCRFWPSVFRKHGYQTAHIGKWHTGTDTGAGRDWDHQIVWNRPRYQENAGNYYKDQLIEINGGKPKLVKGYSTDNYTKWAESYIRGEHRDKKKPWYLWVCYGAVHGPFTPAKRHLNAYADIKVPAPKDIYPPRAGKPAYASKMRQWAKGKNGEPFLIRGAQQMATIKPHKGIHGETLTAWVRQYHQGVLAIDEGVGRLTKALEETGQLENTLIIFTSDQGFGWGQHGFRHKLAPYDATIRSPLIISRPGTLPEGKVVKSPVSGVDIAPTIFSVAGLPLPWKMHGHSLLPLLKNPNANWPHPVLTTLTGRNYGTDCDRVPTDPKERDLAGIPWWVSLRQGRYKYIRTLVKGEIEELYDLDADPAELVNLALDPEHRNKLAEFRAATIAELRRTGAGMVKNLPPVRKLADTFPNRRTELSSVQRMTLKDRNPRHVSLLVDAERPGTTPSCVALVAAENDKPSDTSARALAGLKKWLRKPADQRGPIEKQDFASIALTRRHAAQAEKLLWNDWVANTKRERAAEMKNRVLKHGKHEMKFAYRIFGKKPKGGRSLFISMHGGGGAPKRVNDQQWENQKRLYAPKEGVYVAPRAPTDTWNLWHQGHIDPLFDRLIQNMVLFGDVNPNKVYLMGYSAGGDGAFQLAPRMADRWAAVAMMAGHPNETSPLGLRNIGFTIHMGERDAAYNRNKVAGQWKEKLAKLHKNDPKGYRHHVEIHKGLGHWMQRRDAVALGWMKQFTRDTIPEKVVWKQDDVTHSRFYWLAVPDASRKARSEIVAERDKQTITLSGKGVAEVTLLLNDRVANLDRPVVIKNGTKTLFQGQVDRTIDQIAESIAARGDRDLIFSSSVTVTLPKN